MMTAAKQEWNANWDKVVKPNATPLKEAEDGQMYQLDSARLVVLNGNYHQMGRQYGLLLRDDLMKMRDLMKAQLITTGIMTYDEVKSAVGEPFFQAKPRRQKELRPDSDVDSLSRRASIEPGCKPCNGLLIRSKLVEHKANASEIRIGNENECIKYSTRP